MRRWFRKRKLNETPVKTEHGRSESSVKNHAEAARNRFVAKERGLHVEANADVSRSSGKHYTSLPDRVSRLDRT